MKTAISIAVLAALAATSASATDLIDTAQVISSTPIVERISEPRQECSPVPTAAPAPAQERNMTGVVLGGIAGGILGNQVGRGSGKTVAAAAGAVIGSMVGDRIVNPAEAERPVSGAVVGAAAGGLLGAQVGKGNGQNAAAAAGAVIGAVTGDRVQNAQRVAAPAQQCRTVHATREVIRGYTVVYRYNGRDITTTLPYEPGRTVRVGVGVVDGAPASAGAPTGSHVSAASGYSYRY